MAASGEGRLSREDKILDLVKDLAFAITEHDILDDDESKAFVENAAVALNATHAPKLNEKTQQEQVDSLELKFMVHGFPHLANSLLHGVQEVYEMKNKFLNSDTPCNMIDLLMRLSWKPLERAQQLTTGEIVLEEPVVPPLDEELDWPAHMKEGNFTFRENTSGTDSDAWSQLSEEEEKDFEVLYVNPAESESSLDVQPSQESILTVPSKSHTKFQIYPAEGFFKYSSDPFIAKTNFFLNTSPREEEPAANHEEKETSTNSKGTSKELDACAQKMKQRLQTLFKSKQELDKNFQEGGWFAPETMIKYPKMPSLELGKKTETSELTEWQILREVLWMLQAPTNCRCFGLDPSGKFQPRPDFTVEDVNMPVTWHFLERFCIYFDMVYEVEQFSVGLRNGTKEPPTTYQVYFEALNAHVNEFKMTVAQVMWRVVQQETTETLMSVFNELQPAFERLKFVIALHRKATCDWTDAPNWLAAIRLLSVLYWTVTESVRLEYAAIATDLFLKSFEPYVIILDNLLTLGKCLDYHQEFIIYRADDLDTSMRESWDEGFYVRPYARALRDAGIVPLSMLENVVAEIVAGCKSVYVVERMNDLHKADGYYSKCTLYNDLIALLEEEFSQNKYQSDSLVDLSEEPSSIPVESTASTSCHQTICTEELYDPWLSQAFKGVINFDKKKSKERKKFVHPCERLKKYTSTELIRYQSIFEQVFRGLISTKYNFLGKLINAVMRNKVQIGKHLKALRAMFMIEAGDLIVICYDCLVKKDKDEPYWLYSRYLANNIEDYFVKSFPSCNNFQVSVDKRFVDDNILEMIEGIELTYKVDWPLSFIINGANLEVYNEIFRMLLKLKMILISLERLHFANLDPPGSSKKRTALLTNRLSRWQLLRFQLINVVGGIHCFTMNHIKHTFGLEVDQHVESANDFDLLVQVHSNYLQTVHGLCSNPLCNPVLAESFSKLLELALCCIDLWPFGRREAMDEKLTDLEETYKLIHHHVNSQLQDYIPSDSRLDINGLQALFY